MKARILLLATLYLFTAGAAAAQSALPDPARTPDAVNPAVTQGNIDSTICVRGWACRR